MRNLEDILVFADIYTNELIFKSSEKSFVPLVNNFLALPIEGVSNSYNLPVALVEDN